MQLRHTQININATYKKLTEWWVLGAIMPSRTALSMEPQYPKQSHQQSDYTKNHMHLDIYVK